ncbi:MAG: hypothetical protein ACE5OZ_15645 [Candidatus Heimdallarchaeota archaeon]
MSEEQTIQSLEQKIKDLEQELEFYKTKSKERDCALAAFGRAANILATGGPKYEDAVRLFVDSFLAGLDEYKMSLEVAQEATKEALTSSSTRE